ncbi:unnamed protein product [Mucor hiemalis]
MSKQNQVSKGEARMFTPMEAILDSSFGALTCPTCDGLFTQESFLKSHYLSDENECTQPLLGIVERIFLCFTRDTSQDQSSRKIPQTIESNISNKKEVLGSENAWKCAILVLLVYILYNVSSLAQFLSDSSEADCLS